MKKLIFTLGLGLSLFSFAVYTQAQTATPSSKIDPSPTETISEKEIQNLKDKVATKVAELNKNKKAFAGTVEEIGKDNLKINTEDNKQYKVNIDTDFAKAYSIAGSGQTEIKLAVLKKGDYVIVSGVMIDDTINANYVYKDEPFLVKSGKITEVNKTDYYLRVLTTEKDNYILDIENSTKQQIMNIKDLGFERVGFSKIKEGDTIHFVVKQGSDQKEKNRFSIARFLIIPQEYF